MLIVEFSVNFHGIDELQIHRFETSKNGYHTYRVVKPKGFEDVEIKHHYDKGYFDLVLKVMKELKKRGYSPGPSQSWKEINNSYEN